MSQQPGSTPQGLEILVPEGLAAGTYANFLSAWHTPFEFTLDFAVNQPPEPRQAPDGSPLVVVPMLVVARIKLPPPMMQRVLQAVSTNVSKYEAEMGEIPNVADDDPIYPPEE